MTVTTPAARGGRRLPAGRLVAFAISNVPLYGLTVAISVQMPRYFASHWGIGLAVVGAAFGTVRLLDIWLDPVLGIAMDRTRSRFGRYRLWMVIGAPVLMLALAMLFREGAGGSQIYLIGWLLVMYLGFSILSLAQSAWASSLATSYQERSRIFGTIAAAGVIGAVAVLATPILSAKLGRTDAQGVQSIGWLIIGLIPVAVLICVGLTRETLAKSSHAHFRLRDYWRLFTRLNVLRVLAADLCLTLGPNWMSAMYLFFFKDSRGFTTSQANLLLMIYLLVGFVGAPGTAWLAGRIGKHRALIFNTTLYSLTLVSLILIPKSAFFAALPVMMLLGALNAGLRVMVQAITGDLGDEIRLEGGREQTGLLFALTTATTKLASAFSIFMTFGVLARIGYSAKEGAINSASQIHGLEIAFLSGPILFVMLGGACFLGYKLDAAAHGEIRRRLDERDALVGEGLPAETEAADIVAGRAGARI